MRLHAISRAWLVVICLVAANLAMPSIAHAQTANNTTTNTTTSECDKYAGLTHKMAGCIRDTIDDASALFFSDFYPALQNSITAVLTLAVLVYGVMLSMGLVEKVGRDTFVLVLKIACVAFFTASSPYMLKTITGAMDAAAFAVVGYAPPSGEADGAGTDYSQSKCMQKMVEQQGSADPDKPAITPWLGIDCLIDTVVGIKLPEDNATPPATGNQYFNDVLDNADPTKSNHTQARSLIYMFFSSMQTSIFGAILALVGFFFLFGLLMLVVRAFFIYIAGYMGITVLIIVSPLIIPMVLFRETKQYFDKWTKLLIGFALQPVMMLTFIIFSLMAVDLATFSADYSLMYRIAGDATRQPHFDLNQYLTVKRHPDGTALAPNDPNATPPTYPDCTDCHSIIENAPKTLAEIKADNPKKPTVIDTDQGGLFTGTQYSKCTDDALRNEPANSDLRKACKTVYGVKVALNGINWELMAKAHQPAITAPDADTTLQAEMEREVLSALFFCVMVVFILNGILVIVPAVVTDLLGDFNQSPNLGQAFGVTGSGGGVTGGAGMGGVLGRISAPFRSAGRR